MANSVGADGLTKNQRLVLFYLAEGKSISAVARKTGIGRRTIHQWKKDNDAFRRAYEDLFIGADEDAAMRVKGAAQRATDVLLEAMEATKDADMEVTCPGCQLTFEVHAEVADHRVRLRAAQIAHQGAGILKEIHEVKGTVTVLSLGERVALALYKSGEYDKIPDPMWDKLRELGIIQEATRPQLPRGGQDETDSDSGEQLGSDAGL